MPDSAGRPSGRRFALALAALLAQPYSAAAKTPSLIGLTDDRGQPLSSAVEACFQIELRQTCVEVAASTWLDLPATFESLRVEGADHGPFSAKANDVGKASSEGKGLVIPRKATLRIGGPVAATATVALHPLDDPDPRRPAFRRQLGTERTFKVPAGEFLVAVSDETLAPNLHLLELPPATQRDITFQRKAGWSLVLRAVAAESARPIPEVDIELSAVEGFSTSNRTALGKTERRGYAIWSGLEDAVMRARLKHPSFVAREESALLASPGTFAYQSVRLEHGGAVRATVRLEGELLAGAKCEVLLYPRRRAPGTPPEIFFEGLSGRGGDCVSGRLPTGSYHFVVSESSRRAKSVTTVTILEGQTTAVEVNLYPIHVTGTVRLGSRPAEAFQVHAYPTDPSIPSALPPDAAGSATSDEDGEYDLELWAAGSYALSLDTAKGVPAQAKKLDRLVGDEIVDFQLDDATIFGFVEDEAGKPVQGAQTILRWTAPDGRGVHRQARIGADGAFSFPMETTGPVEIFASKQGYRPADPQTLEFVAGSALGPLRLVLRKDRAVRGSVVDPAGAPLAGAEVTISSPGEGSQRRLGTARSDAGGEFEIPIPGAAPTEGFVGGPGCPLAAFGVPQPDQGLRIACPDIPAALALTLLDRDGTPLPASSFILRTGGHVLPADVVARHQSLFQSPTQTDASGRLVFIALAPGEYDVFLAGATNESLVASGAALGYLGSYSLAPLRLTEAEAQVTWERSLLEAPR